MLIIFIAQAHQQDSNMRQLDPLFGGLNRDARFLRLPMSIFVLWLMTSALLGVVLNGVQKCTTSHREWCLKVHRPMS